MTPKSSWAREALPFDWQKEILNFMKSGKRFIINPGRRVGKGSVMWQLFVGVHKDHEGFEIVIGNGEANEWAKCLTCKMTMVRPINWIQRTGRKGI